MSLLLASKQLWRYNWKSRKLLTVLSTHLNLTSKEIGLYVTSQHEFLGTVTQDANIHQQMLTIS